MEVYTSEEVNSGQRYRSHVKINGELEKNSETRCEDHEEEMKR
jgi:hypothetical protein